MPSKFNKNKITASAKSVKTNADTTDSLPKPNTSSEKKSKVSNKNKVTKHFSDKLGRNDLLEQLKDFNKKISSKDRAKIVTPLLDGEVITKASLSQMLSGTFISEANLPIGRAVLRKIDSVFQNKNESIRQILS